MRLLVLLFCFLSLNAMEEPKTVAQFALFDQLRPELRAKIVIHLCDDVPTLASVVFIHKPKIDIPLFQDMLTKILPIFRVSKKYYLHDIQFAEEIIKLVGDKCWQNTVYVGVNVPIPACKRFLSKYKEILGDPKKQFEALLSSPAFTLNYKELHMLNDIKNNRIRFKESLQVTQNPNY